MGAPQLRTLVLTENPQDPMWLMRGAPAGAARIGLPGRVMTSPSVEDIVPLQVMELTACALCRYARITLLHSLRVSNAPAPAWLDVTPGQTTSLRPGGSSRLFARKSSFPLHHEPDDGDSAVSGRRFRLVA